MKKCLKCNDLAIYDDPIVNCPLCNTKLSDYKPANRSGTVSNQRGSYENTDDGVNPRYRRGESTDSGVSGSADANTAREEYRFETASWWRYVYRGNIAEYTPVTRYFNRFHKLVNCIFRGEPYQFGHSTHYCTIRIEEQVTGAMPSRRRDVIFYGDVEGLFTYGDDVTVTAKRKRNRYVVQRMFLNDTEARIRPSLQLPAWMVNLLCLGFLFLLAALVIGIISFFTTGAFINTVSTVAAWIGQLFLALGSALFPVLAIIIVVRMLFRRR